MLMRLNHPTIHGQHSTPVSGGTKYNYPAGHLGLTSTIAPTLTAL